ncbi:MAG: ATP-binding protein [bacterium]|nr:ATP-binding protein [bacterium]
MKQKKPFSSISKKLIKSVFSIYFALTFLITAGHFSVEYINSKSNIKTELQALTNTFALSLETALWELNDAQVQSISQGVVNQPIVLGVEMTNLKGEILNREYAPGFSPGKQGSFGIEFDVLHPFDGRSVHLAKVHLYSDSTVVFERVKVGFLLIFLNAAIKSALLTFLILWAFNRQLTQPLKKFTARIAEIDIEKPPEHFQFSSKDNNELKYLESAYNLMLDKIAAQTQALEAEKERATKELEERVEARTAELTLANQALEKLNQDKSEFLGIAAHDLKSPLGGLVGWTEYLLDEPELDPDEVREFLEMALISTKGMVEHVNLLLNVTSIESGLILHARELSLNELAKNSITALEGLAKKKQISIEPEFAPDPLAVQLDPKWSPHIFENLLSNAVKYSPPGSKVQVRTFHEGTKVCYSVHDQGPGIPADQRDQLFKKYSRLSTAPTGGETATGLGLYITKLVVEASEGTVVCTNELEGGATFVVSFPEALPRLAPQNNRQAS